MRRINGGGRERTLIELYPLRRPEILSGANGPVVFHSDYSPVSAASPARAGETLIVYALGPTIPGVNPGGAFPSEPLAVATSPVEVLVNGRSSPAINQIGVPATTDTYRVDFRVPDVATGLATLQVSAAWVKGAPVTAPVRKRGSEYGVGRRCSGVHRKDDSTHRRRPGWLAKTKPRGETR
jgi:uncharacterized protein (TIGR03437 family)